jgi:glucosamine--fructose-6-phosphate aminotransferase (isomerizing)
MNTLGKHTFEEILSQIDAWEEAREVVERERFALASFAQPDANRQFFFTGCGSTYYLALAAAAHLRSLAHRRAQGVPASELWLDGDAYWRNDDLLIAVSRSGTTTETLRAVEAYRSATRRSPITIGCSAESLLAQRGQVNLIIPRGAEKSVAQTRSFASMFVAAVGLNARLARRDDLCAELAHLPRVGERLLGSAQALGQSWGRRLEFDRTYFLGSGTRYGLACEASLKMKEMSLSHSEPFHFMEFRHGPKSMITETTLVVGLVSERNRPQEVSVLDEVAALGARTIALGERVARIGEGAALSFESALPEQVRDVLYLPPLQMLAFERAIAKGLDPDQPRHLDAVVKLEHP